MAKRRRVGNVVYQFPDDATEQEIAESLNAKYQQGPPNAGLADVSRPVDPILKDSRDPRSAVYQDSPFHESTSAENLAGWVDEGPIKTGQGVKEMVTPGTFKRGVHDAISGAGTTAAPATAFAPPAAVVRSAIGGYLGSKAGEAGAKSWGADEDTTQMVSDLGGVAGGYVGYKAPEIAASPVRAAGRVIQRASSMPDLPIDTPSRSANIFSKVANASRGAVSRGGRVMANYKIPQAPNVYNGDANGPLSGEPDLPTPVKPDGVAHHNDVTDELELNKLLDQVSQQPEVRQGRDPVQADRLPHHDDISHIDRTPPREPNVQSQSPSEDLEGMAQRQGIDLGRTTPVKGADDLAQDPTANIPTPNSDALLRAIKSAPGWPENGLPNEPWDDIYNEEGGSPSTTFRKPIPPDEVDEMLGIMTNKNNPLSVRRVGLRDINVNDISPSEPWQDGERVKQYSDMQTQPPPIDLFNIEHEGESYKVIGNGPGGGGHHRTLAAIMSGRDTVPANIYDTVDESEIDPELQHALDTDPYNRPDEQQVQSPSYSGAERRGFSRSVGGLSDAADNNDFQTAKSSLGPDASVSQIALEAQRLKDIRTKGIGDR